MSRKPNFIYIGTSKAGSTWLFDLLSRHPDIFMTPAKGLYFFDRHFENGWDWYLNDFSDASTQSIVGEISHSYLYSELACERIAEMNPNIKLMVCLREPIDRAFSMYLDGIRNGKWTGSFEQEWMDRREIFQEGLYAQHLERYLDRFPREQIHITLFDDLKRTPEGYADSVFDFLGITRLPFEPVLKQKVMPACVPRNDRIVRVSKSLSQTCRKLGWKKIRGRVKRSRWIRNLLYRPVQADQRAEVSEEMRRDLKQRYQSDVQRLDQRLGMGLCERWGYESSGEVAVEERQEVAANR